MVWYGRVDEARVIKSNGRTDGQRTDGLTDRRNNE